MSRSSVQVRQLFRRFTKHRLETGFSMLEAVVVVGVLLALAVSGFLAYGPITENAKKAKVRSAASEIHTGVLVASSDGDINTKPEGVISDWNASTDKIKVEILSPAAGSTSANGDYCVQATNLETPSITAREGACDAVVPSPTQDTDGDGIPDSTDPDIDGDGIPNADDTTPNGGSTPPTGGGDGTYSASGVVPAGYTYGANTGACPAPFADALKAKIIADGSQSYFQASYLYSTGDRAGSDAAWDAYYVLDDAYSAQYSAMTSSQRSTMDTFSGYVNDVPGYTDLNNIFWNTPNQTDFNSMSEKMASAVPAFCGAVTAGTGTLKCHAETRAYIALANPYYHNYMYENKRYEVDSTQANYDSWTAALRAQDPKLDGSGQVYADDAAKQAAYDAMVNVVGGDWEVTMAQNMHREELNAALATFTSYTSRADFDTWVNYEYPINACR